MLAVVLSEILANEPGGSTTLEWIELEIRQSTSLAGYTLHAGAKDLVLPDSPVTPGFIVICRDSVRFEQHFGDSSGVWGDVSSEDYPLIEASFSLTNSSGAVELVAADTVDRFQWDGTAPDGVSYERIDDRVWQVTASSVGSTPGRRNHGAPVRMDWAIVGVQADPGPSRVSVRVLVENVGTDSSGSAVLLRHSQGSVLDSASVSGPSGSLHPVTLSGPVEPGFNRLSIELTDDERAANNHHDLHFLTGESPALFSELYVVPEATEPEWIEIRVTSDTGLTVSGLQLADTRDTTRFQADQTSLAPDTYVILTEDSPAFTFYFGEVGAPVLQADHWPTLNNDGDTLTLLLMGAVSDHVGYPSAGSRRGVALERIGSSAVWNWSVAPGGATPGGDNSVDVPYTADIELDIAPNPFAAGYGERATIAYRVPFGAEGQLQLYGGDGRRLRTLFDTRPFVSGEVTWDGRDQSGQLLPVGVYLVCMRLFSPRELVRLAPVAIGR